MSFRPGEPDRVRSGPFGSSSTTISIAILVIVLGLLGIAAVLLLQDDSDGDSAAADFPTSTPTLIDLTEGTAPPSATGELVEQDTTPTERQRPTSSPTSEPTTPSPTPGEPTVEPTEPVEPTPTEGEVVEPEPTPTEETVEEPEEPPIGDYGQLPPAQLPSGGAALSLSLDYELGMSLESLPAAGTVYRIEWPSYSFDEVQQAAINLGLDGEVVEEGVGIYRVDSDAGSLYVSTGEIIYHASGSGEGSTPDDGTAISVAREWLLASGLIGGNMDPGAVVGRDEDSGRVIVKFRPVEPQPNLAPQPSATVTVGPGSTVVEARIRWPGSLAPSDYGFMAPIDIWSMVQSGRGYLEADLSSVFGSGPLSGTATITDYSIAYTMSGSPSGDEYLVPIITFHGTALLEQTGDEIPVSVSVPAVYHQSGSLG